MNQEDILKMAREAGFKGNSFSPVIARHSAGYFVDMRAEVERFAALVAAKAAQEEREACAALCHGISEGYHAREEYETEMCVAMECEEAIRARGE